jgi:hypothetical protein
VNGVDEADLVVGVDTHLDTCTAAICDARGRAVSQLQVPAATAGYGQLLSWVRASCQGPLGRLGGGRDPALRAGPGPGSRR